MRLGSCWKRRPLSDTSTLTHYQAPITPTKNAQNQAPLRTCSICALFFPLSSITSAKNTSPLLPSTSICKLSTSTVLLPCYPLLMLPCQYVMPGKLFISSCFVLFFMFVKSSSFGMYVLWFFSLFFASFALLILSCLSKIVHNVLHYNFIIVSYPIFFVLSRSFFVVFFFRPG